MSGTENSQQKISLPSGKTLEQAAKLSIKVSKPICFYFYIDSCKGNISIVNSEGDKIVYKNTEEHTSPINNTFQYSFLEFLILNK